MKFLNDQKPPYELTYSDAFLVPTYTDVMSRFDVDITPQDKSGATIPIVIANMNAVAGRRMSETVARRGGITILPQDMPLEEIGRNIRYIKDAGLVYETPLTLSPNNTVSDALSLINKRAHGTIIVTNDKNEPVGTFTEADALGIDRFTPVSDVMSTDLVTIESSLPIQKIFESLQKAHVDCAPVIEKSKLIGIVTQKGMVRSEIYQPAVNKKHELMTAVAVGVNGDVEKRAASLLALGVDILVIDTAHGHQKKMIDAIKAVRKVSPTVPIVAGNVVTAEATRALINAGANIVKVGVGPGAMCTTRVMTAVGRPQLGAVIECSEAARKLGGHVWADGGVKFPRDVALALAAGASSVMVGSIASGTFESVGDVLIDETGRMYKENYGMASRRAVQGRTKADSSFQQMKKRFFEEGISNSKMYLDELRPGVEDIIDYLTAGLRSSMSYTGAMNLEEFHEKAVIGIQSAAGFAEGLPTNHSWL